MSGHGRVICPKCGTTVMQCRCWDSHDKVIGQRLCSDCARVLSESLVAWGTCQTCGTMRPRDQMIIKHRPISPAHAEVTVRCPSCEGQIERLFPPMPKLTAILDNARREQVEANPSIVLGED